MTALRRLAVQPWIWSFLGAAAIWAATVAAVGGQGAGATLTAALVFSVFYILVGIGQMFVITLGPGNVDLSVPATMVLAGVVAMETMAGRNTLILPGLLLALALGAGIGAANFTLIRLLSIPPIIATLSSSLILQSVAIAYGRGLRVRPPPALEAFVTDRMAGVPLPAVLALGVTMLAALVLRRTPFGRSVLAVGQNMRAAGLAGIRVDRTRLLTYTGCAALAALAGVLLAAFSGGASLDMGAPFLLASIAVVVIGGTNVAGGQANLPGLWGAALFLFLLVTMLNAFGVSTGVRQVLTGVIIVAVITLAGGERAR